MKAFTMPEIEVQRFAIADVITTSGGSCADDCMTDSAVCPFD